MKQEKKGFKAILILLIAAAIIGGAVFAYYKISEVKGTIDNIIEVIVPPSDDDQGELPTIELPDEEEYVYVLLDKQNGDDVEVYKLNRGQVFHHPETPTREGYVFENWISSLPYNFGMPVEQNLTITASWIKLFTVTFDYVIVNRIESFQFMINEVIDYIPIVEGRTFLGWSYNGQIITDIKVMEDMKLAAVWVPEPEPDPEPVYYTVTINLNNGSAVIQHQVLAGQVFSRPTDPTRVGYEFVGWLGYNFTQPINSNITIIAQWQIAYQQINAISDLFEFDSESRVIISGVVNFKSNTQFAIEDASGAIYCIGNANIKLGDRVQIKGVLSAGTTYKTISSISQVIILEENQTIEFFVAESFSNLPLYKNIQIEGIIYEINTREIRLYVTLEDQTKTVQVNFMHLVPTAFEIGQHIKVTGLLMAVQQTVLLHIDSLTDIIS